MDCETSVLILTVPLRNEWKS